MTRLLLNPRKDKGTHLVAKQSPPAGSLWVIAILSVQTQSHRLPTLLFRKALALSLFGFASPRRHIPPARVIALPRSSPIFLEPAVKHELPIPDPEFLAAIR
jgi:hypothetical protein